MKCRICDRTIRVAEPRSYVRLSKGDYTSRKVYACGDCQEAFDRWIDALPVDVDGQPIDVSRNEAKALLLATDRRALLKRLRVAQSLLTADVRQHFGRGHFNFDECRLTGDNGMVLQWKTRNKPDEPVEHLNQQTTEGIVQLL